MMPSKHKVYLHVGLPKTATTFLQTEIFPELPVLYSDHKRSNFENSLRIEEIHALHSTSQLAIDDSFVNRVNERIEELFSQTGGRRLLISDESLVGGWYNNYLSTANIQQILTQLFPDATILLTIRRQDSFVKSLYSTSLSIGNSLSFHQFVNYRDGSFTSYRRISQPNLDIATLNWNVLVKSYERLFGPDNVVVVPFELIRESVEAYIQRIAHQLGISFEGPPATGKRNPSLGKVGLGLTRLKNKLGLANTQIIENIMSTIGISPIQTLDSLLYFESELSDDLQSEILTQHAESNRKLPERYDLDLDRYGYF